jgi:chromosomal replication initiation ATPase DnaA
MGKIEDFSKVIKVVTELMDVTDQDILGHNRRQDVVDARWMVITLMRDKGYSTRQIAHLMLKPERTINNAISQFSDRVKYSYNQLGCMLATARQQLL